MAGIQALFGLLDRYEGGGRYDTLVGHSQRAGGRFAGTDITRMTLGQLRQFSDPSGEYGQWVRNELARGGQMARVATPMGRGQIVGTTMRNVQAALGLSDDTLFNEATQLQMIDYLARQRLRGANTAAGRRAALRAEWEGFNNVSDRELDAAIEGYLSGGPYDPSTFSAPQSAPQNALAAEPQQTPQNALTTPQRPIYAVNALDPQAFMSRRNNLPLLSFQ